MRQRDFLCPGELGQLPPDYGVDERCPHHRYLPEGYGDAPPRWQESQEGRAEDVEPNFRIGFSHSSRLSVGEVQRQLPKPEKMRDLVKYKGPAAQNVVLKQAVTNAELQKAVEAGDSDLVAALLRFGLSKRCVHPDAPLWPKRERLLHIAARQNRRDICVMLLEAKAALDSEEITDGRQPLHDACMHGSYDVVELLLDRRARLEDSSFTGMRPVHWAAAGGHADVVDLLLDRGASHAVASGNTLEPLHHAASSGHEAVVRLLCRRGARVDAQTHNGQRALHLACHGGHVAAAGALLDYNALSVVADFGEKGVLQKWRGSSLEELVLAVERLRFRRDEAEELHDVGQDDEAAAMFAEVVHGFAELGLAVASAAARADAERCGCGVRASPVGGSEHAGTG